MPTISFPISLETEYYAGDLPKIQGMSFSAYPPSLVGTSGRSLDCSYTTEYAGWLFTSESLIPLSPTILTGEQHLNFPLPPDYVSQEAVENLIKQTGYYVPISNESYKNSAARGLSFAGMRPVGDQTFSIILPPSMAVSAGGSVTIRIFCSLDDDGCPCLAVKSEAVGIEYTYKLPNDLPYFIFNFAVTAPGGGASSTRVNETTTTQVFSIMPGGGSGASMQLTAVLYTRPYIDFDTGEPKTDSIEITYTLADKYGRRSSSDVGYLFGYVSDTENGIDTVEIKANLSYSFSANEYSSYRRTYQMTTVLSGGLPYVFYTSTTVDKPLADKLLGILDNMGYWVTTFTDPQVQEYMRDSKFMSVILASEPTMLYPEVSNKLFASLPSDFTDYQTLAENGLCHLHPCTNFNPEGLFYTPVFQSSDEYTSVLQDKTIVSHTAAYYGVPGKPSIFSNSPAVDSKQTVNRTGWWYSSTSNELLPGVGATGARGTTMRGTITQEGPNGETIEITPRPTTLPSEYLKAAGPAAIVINL